MGGGGPRGIKGVRFPHLRKEIRDGSVKWGGKQAKDLETEKKNNARSNGSWDLGRKKEGKGGSPSLSHPATGLKRLRVWVCKRGKPEFPRKNI